MLTNRARWMVFFGVIGTLGGLLRSQEVLALLSLSVLAWLFIEWTLFRWRIEVQFRSVECQRFVNDSKSSHGTLWTGRPINVLVRVRSTALTRIPFLRLEDFVPENLEAVDKENVIDATLSGKEIIEFSYTAKTRGAGTVVLPGVCARIFDLNGLFFAQRFLPFRQSFRVMPTCVAMDIGRSTTKRMNALPPPGIHRLQQAGMGAELLELREYAPGDPPKSIAWKVSARRDILMTRQYESEVPVRSTLFVDTSYGTQIGSFGKRPLDHLITVAGTIARSLMANKDPVGIVTFEESKSRTFQSGLGERHFFRLLDILTDCATTQSIPESNKAKLHEPTSPPPVQLTDRLLEYAWDTANDLFPHLLLPNVNRIPFTIFPIFPVARQRMQRRMRLAALVAQLYDLPPDAPVRMMYHDRLMARQLQRLLMDSGFAWVQPIVPRRGREIHDWHGKFDTLTESLTRAIARGRDNELFILLVDLVDYVGKLGKLAHAIRVARARHHRVIVICPWPDEEPPNFDEDAKDRFINPSDIMGLLKRSERARLNAAAIRLRSELRRIGVPLAFTFGKESLLMVMSQAELARNGRTTARSV
jgi:uncharacterized protein (DUF58 family)